MGISPLNSTLRRKSTIRHFLASKLFNNQKPSLEEGIDNVRTVLFLNEHVLRKRVIWRNDMGICKEYIKIVIRLKIRYEI